MFTFLITTILICIFIVPTIIDTSLNKVSTIENEQPLYYYQDDSIRMKDYLLIGTHGSVSYTINTNILVDDRGVKSKQYLGYIVPGIIKRWSKNQHYDILSQLRMGARFLHIEVGWYHQQYVAIHSYYCMTLLSVFQQINTFLEHTTKGFVILQLQTFGSFPADHNFNAYKRTYNTFNKTLSEFTLLKDIYKKLVILDTFHQRPRLERSDWEFFVNAEISEIVEKKNRNLVMSGFSWVMTPNQNIIINSIRRPFNYDGLYTFPSVTQKPIMKMFVQSYYKKLQSQYICFIVDHLDYEDIRIIETVNNPIYHGTVL